MIAALTGTIISITPDRVTLDVRGVGYLIFISPNSISQLQSGQQLSLFIHTAVSETDIRLFGFHSQPELDLFKKLLGVKGVGPKVALAIFSLPLPVIETAIAAEDHKTLASVPGLGAKTAQQICLDLRGKIDFANISVADLNSVDSPQTGANPHIGDACEALCNLGCERGEVMRALVKAPADMSSEALVKWFLNQG